MKICLDLLVFPGIPFMVAFTVYRVCGLFAMLAVRRDVMNAMKETEAIRPEVKKLVALKYPNARYN